MSKAERIHMYRRHWAEEIIVVVLVVVSAGIALFFIREGRLDPTPWAYIATAVAILGALTGMILTIAEAMHEGGSDEFPPEPYNRRVE